MCVIIFAWKVHPEYPLILIENRDEFYDRDTLPAARWVDNPTIFAGRDGERGGTWAGMTDQGRLAAITNFRDGMVGFDGFPRSRGQLTVDFLRGDGNAEEYLRAIEGELYGGYTLIVGTIHEGLWWSSNRAKGLVREIEPGIHGLSNHLMDADWPKVQWGKASLESLLIEMAAAENVEEDQMLEKLFEILMNDKQAADEDLPSTGVDAELEKAWSSMFVATPGYGTRSSTVILARKSGEIRFVEKSFGPQRKLLHHVDTCLRDEISRGDES